MREELIRVLNYKLDDINRDIDGLVNLNSKIEEEKEKTGFVTKILDIFNDNNVNNPLNLAKISKEDFERVLEITGDEIKGIFDTPSCNYEGLVYLINGINNGVSLSLTDEQRNGIEYLIKSLTDKKKEYDSAVDGYTLVKSRYGISDVDVLRDKKEEYTKLISGLDHNDYVKDTNLLVEAIKFSALTPEETVNLLTYVLEYNANIYQEYRPSYVEEKEEKTAEEPVEEKEEEKPKEDAYANVDLEFNPDDEFHFNSIDKDDLFRLPNITFDDEPKEEPVEEKISEESHEEPKDEVEIPEYQEFEPYVETEENEEVSIPDELTYVPAMDEPSIPEQVEDNVTIDSNEDEPASNFEPTIEFEEEKNEEPVESIPEETIEEPIQEEMPIDNDFKDVISSNEDYEEKEEKEEKISTRELQKIFGKYGIEENTVLNELIDGNVSEYQNILDTLKDNDVLEYFKNNRELLVETLLYSDADVVDKILKIVKDDLSVDDEDYGITLKIVINTIPSVFVRDGGNYDNFIKNVELFKDLGINLINLFDFSKEIFVADNSNIVKNVDIINKYGFDINYKNAKYFLLIPNIADKLDLYIESVYEDKTKNEMFDGVEYIKNYAAKLNVVTDETIRRLRYSSENGKKVFGSKPGSLSGEITNLKVNALDIGSDYVNKFFNNEFANLTGDEVREYIKLIHNSSNVGNYSDELDMLNNYRDGLRYVMEGINISYNKVNRNYNVLRSYGISSKKALQFAVCYNLIITKEEYDKLNSLLDTIGGNE